MLVKGIPTVLPSVSEPCIAFVAPISYIIAAYATSAVLESKESVLGVWFLALPVSDLSFPIEPD